MEPPSEPASGSFTTRAVHGAQMPEVGQRPVSPPIQPSATWAVDASADLAGLLDDERDGYVYSRYDNPTNSALHSQVAALHDTESAWSFASGTAAIQATLETLRWREAGGDAGGPGAILATRELYGGTHALLERLRGTAGWTVDRVDITDPGAVAERLDDSHTVVYAETIANPTTTVADLERLGNVCRQADVSLVVDNTFASPYLCRPTEFGATAVVESATKYLGGHGDVVAGVMVGSRDLVAEVRHATYETGASLGPFEAWLVARGLQTLALRMRQSSASALALAGTLVIDERVVAVAYPGLQTHPQHEVANRLFTDRPASPGELDAADRPAVRGYGAVLGIDLGDAEVAETFADACRLFSRAASLGATHSLVIHPASTTHRQLDVDELRQAGIGPGFVRLAVGIEDTEDLLNDVNQALDVAYGAR